MGQDEIKSTVGRAAAKLIKNDMIVGLGTGTTAAFFIQALIDRIKNEDLKIKAAASSSQQSAELAKKGGINVVDINEVQNINITVDGADEVDSEKRLIKGGGGALLREKILASSSEQIIIIVDQSKISQKLGKAKLPVEIARYGYKQTESKMLGLNYSGTWRKNKENDLFITENGNMIFDIQFSAPLTDPEKEHDLLIKIPGVVETGFFFELADKVLVGYENSQIEIL